MLLLSPIAGVEDGYCEDDDELVKATNAALIWLCIHFLEPSVLAHLLLCLTANLERGICGTRKQKGATSLGLHLEEMPRNMPHACQYFNQGGSHRCIGSSNNLNVFLFLTMCENSNLCLEIATLSRVR